jgi:hypothetical protein
MRLCGPAGYVRQLLEGDGEGDAGLAALVGRLLAGIVGRIGHGSDGGRHQGLDHGREPLGGSSVGRRGGPSLRDRVGGRKVDDHREPPMRAA